MHPKEHARWYSSLVTKTIDLPKKEEFPPEKVYLFKGYVYEFA